MNLDQEAQKASVSAKILQDIVREGSKYPKIFTSTAREELIFRKLEIEKEKKAPTQNERLNFRERVSKNPGFLILAILIGFSTGIVGFFVVLMTYYIAVTRPGVSAQKQAWKITTIALVFIDIITVLIGYYLLN